MLLNVRLVRLKNVVEQNYTNFTSSTSLHCSTLSIWIFRSKDVFPLWPNVKTGSNVTIKSLWNKMKVHYNSMGFIGLFRYSIDKALFENWHKCTVYIPNSVIQRSTLKRREKKWEENAFLYLPAFWAFCCFSSLDRPTVQFPAQYSFISSCIYSVYSHPN